MGQSFYKQITVGELPLLVPKPTGFLGSTVVASGLQAGARNSLCSEAAVPGSHPLHLRPPRPVVLALLDSAARGNP